MKKLFQILWLLIKIGLFAIGGLVVLGMFLAVLAALLAAGPQKIADKSVLVFNLNTQINDRPADENSKILSHLLGDGELTLQLRSATTALRAAARTNGSPDFICTATCARAVTVPATPR